MTRHMTSHMTRLARTLTAVLAAFGLQAAEAACIYPPEVNVPEGKTASKEQMTAAGGSVKEYMAKVEEYLACLDKEESDLGDAVTDEQKAVHTAKHNSAVDALNAVAARYNEQVKEFKKAGGK